MLLFKQEYFRRNENEYRMILQFSRNALREKIFLRAEELQKSVFCYLSKKDIILRHGRVIEERIVENAILNLKSMFSSRSGVSVDVVELHALPPTICGNKRVYVRLSASRSGSLLSS